MWRFDSWRLKVFQLYKLSQRIFDNLCSALRNEKTVCIVFIYYPNIGAQYVSGFFSS